MVVSHHLERLCNLKLSFNYRQLTFRVINHDFGICNLICVEHVFVEPYMQFTSASLCWDNTQAFRNFKCLFDILILYVLYWWLVNNHVLLELEDLACIMSHNCCLYCVLDSCFRPNFSLTSICVLYRCRTIFGQCEFKVNAVVTCIKRSLESEAVASKIY